MIRDIFSGMIKVRMGWVLRAIEIYHDITSPIRPPEKVENLPPSKIRRLVYEVHVLICRSSLFLNTRLNEFLRFGLVSYS